MGIAKSDAPSGQSIDVGRMYALGTVAGEITVAHIVGHDDQYVRSALLSEGREGRAQ